jgi:biotin carboxylase
MPDGVIAIATDTESSAEEVFLALARHRIDPSTIGAVLTNNEYNMMAAASLTQMFGCRGITPAEAARFRDKWIQKQILRQGGVAAAESVLIEDITNIGNFTLPWDRAVLKPAAGAATRMTKEVRSTADVVAYGEIISKRTHRKGVPLAFVVEQFQPGQEWLIDGIVADGEVVFASVAEYGQPCLKTIVAGVPLRTRRFDPALEEWAFSLAEPMIGSVVRLLALKDGLFHLEVFYHDGHLTFGECGARRGGALVEEEVEYKFGIDLAEAAVLSVVGKQPEIVTKLRSEVVGATYLAAPPGLLLDAPSEAAIMNRPGVRYAEIEQPIGMNLNPTGDTAGRVGMAMVVADDRDTFDARIADLRDWFAASSDVLPPGLTRRELFARQRART